jgi:guanylate kinase
MHPPEAPPPILAVIGPSASGKSTAVRRLASLGLVTVHPTWTTRPRRADELEGSLEHRFVSDAVFDDLERCGFFVDTVALFGLPHRYGLPTIPRATSPGGVDAVMLRAPVVARFATLVAPPLVYQVEDDLGRAAARLAARGCDRADLEARLADNVAECHAGRAIAHRVFVNDGSVTELVGAIAAALAEDVCVTAEVAS